MRSAGISRLASRLPLGGPLRLVGRPRPVNVLRLLLILTAAAILAACSGPADHPAATAPAPEATYYLALGDSLSRGVQPNAAGVSVETSDGYPDQVYAVLHRAHPGLELETSDFTAGAQKVLRNVALLCQWTWACAAPPRGPNQHANQAGYLVIARTFLQASGLS